MKALEIKLLMWLALGIVILLIALWFATRPDNTMSLSAVIAALIAPFHSRPA